MKSWIALPIAAALVAGCSNSGSSPPSTPSSSPSADSTASPSDSLAGSWQTAALPTATFVATYRKAGGTATQAQQFVGLLTTTPSAGHRVILHIGDGLWVQFSQDDSATPQVGWTGSYEVHGSRVVAHETSTGCELVLRFQVTGGALHFHVERTGPRHDSQCGSVGTAFPTHALYETAAFHRTT